MSKVQFWKKSTTVQWVYGNYNQVCQIYQKYNFESKSLHTIKDGIVRRRCIRYVKSTILKANHNSLIRFCSATIGVSDMSKVQFWKQITTHWPVWLSVFLVYQICQKYNFESKSQRGHVCPHLSQRCIRYVKSTILKANHNKDPELCLLKKGVSDMSKVQFWKQITTFQRV